MARVRCHRWVAALAFGLGALLVPPGALHAQGITLSLSRSGSDVVLTWSGGTAPYRVLRSTSPTFISGNRLLAEGLATTTFTDVGAVDVAHPYYYQVLGVGDDPPPGYEMNPPRARPMITQLSPEFGPRGSTVTIDGQNFSPTVANMYVLFAGSAPAEITASSAIQLTVTVPPGAISGPVRVCVSGVCSPGAHFAITIVPTGVTFHDITSISYEEGTGSLWIGDRGSGGLGDRIYEIDASGTIFERATFNDPFVSDPSLPDGTGRIYFSNGFESTANQGTIKYIDSSDNTEHGFRAAGMPNTDPVWARGMVANDLELNPPTCYFLDGNGNTIRREPRVGLEDKNYGNFTFNFNDPAGGRFDSEGNLYVTSTTELYKIAPDETVTLVASGFTAAAGMDIREFPSFTSIAVADEGAGQIVLVRAETGSTSVAKDGLDSPAAVAFAEDPGSGMLVLAVATASGLMGQGGQAEGGLGPALEDASTLVRVAPGYLEFQFCGLGECRILLSKAPITLTADEYPNPSQLFDAEIVIAAETGEKLEPGDTVYFRLRDPPDLSPYLEGSEDDNLPTAPAGTLSRQEDTVDALRLVATTLTVDPDHSGNNYLVEASLKPEPNFHVLARSPTYTTWRRIYVEHDRMLTTGSFIFADSGGGEPNPARVFVHDEGEFAVGDTVIAISAEGTFTPPGEVRTVVAVGANFVDLDAPLIDLYAATLDFPDDDFPYSFLGNLSASPSYYDAFPNLGVVRQTFDDAFTDWLFVPDGNGFVPLWPYFDPEVGDQLSISPRVSAYFDHYIGQWNTGQPLRNFVQLLSAQQFEEMIPTGGGAFGGATVAENDSDGIGVNVSAIFVHTLDVKFPDPSDNQTVREITINHELAHQFNVNPPTMFGHDMEMAWIDPTKQCIMQTTLSVTNSSLRFHADPSAPTQDLFCVRTHTDDLNQDTCPPYSP